MKIIEAMKKVKENKEKIADLKEKIKLNCAHLNYETPMYPDAQTKIASWAQSCEDLSQENIKLLTSIAKTNLCTNVDIEICGKVVTKMIAELVWRRREYAAHDLGIYSCMTDRGLKEGFNQSTTGVPMEIKIIRKYDVELRDAKINMYKSEPRLIDAKLEVINAITDLV
jgi:hypothetical protein